MKIERFKLTNEGIESCLESFDQIDDKYFRDSKHRLKARLVIENCLLNNQSHFGEHTEFIFKSNERFRHIYFTVEVRGESYDCRIMEGRSLDEIESIILKMTGTFEKRVSYEYKNGLNIISMSLKKEQKIGSAGKMVIAVIAGLLLSILGLVLPEFFRVNLLPVCNQINSIVLGLITMSATLVVFFMNINSITKIGSISIIKKMGGNVLKGYLLRYLFMIILLLAYFFIMFDFTIVTPEQKGGLLSSVVEILGGAFPTSYVTPFVNGNFLQIIIISILIGIATLVVGQPAEPFLKVCKSLDSIANTIMEWCCSLLPIFLALVIPTILWSDDLSLISNSLVHVVGIVVIGLLLFSIFFFVMCSKRKLPVGRSFKIIFPVLAQGFLTSSSTATLPKIIEAGENYGVNDKFNGLASIFGFIFSYCCTIVTYAIMVFYLLVSYQADITVAVIIKLIISAVLLGIASPPVSGGAIAIMAILISMFGLPDSCVSAITPVMIVLDFFRTSMRCGDIVTQTVISAVNMGEIIEDNSQ